MATLDSAVASFVDEHSDAEMLPSGKVRCTVTRHEIPAKLDMLEAHWTGKKYAMKKAQSKYDFTVHEPWIVAHKKDANLLYCTLTKQPMSRQPKTVEGHIKGKRFQRLLQEAKSEGTKVEEGSTKKRKTREEEEEEEGEELFDEGEDGEELFDEEDDEAEGEDNGEGEEGEDDAAEFLREGAFWEDGGEDDEDEEELEEDPDAFWVRGSGQPAPEPTRPLKKKKKQAEVKSVAKSVAKSAAPESAKSKAAPTGQAKAPKVTKGKGKAAAGDSGAATCVPRRPNASAMPKKKKKRSGENCGELGPS